MVKSRLTSKGQITIPKSIRKLLDLDTGSTLLFKIDQEKVIIEKQENKYPTEMEIREEIANYDTSFDFDDDEVIIQFIGDNDE